MKKDLSQDDRKMVGDAGSTPVVGTIFTEDSEEFTNSAYFAHKKAVSFPIIVRERGLTASKYTGANGTRTAKWFLMGP